MGVSTPSDQGLSVVEAQVREQFGRVAYTHKAHEKCAEAKTNALGWLKVVQIALSAITTGSLLLAVFGDSRTGTVVGAILSTLLFGLSAYTKDYDLGELSQKHTDAANRLWLIREEYLALLGDIAGRTIDVVQASQRRDQLVARLSAVYQGAPKTDSKSYKAAQKALQINEEFTFSDDEIDRFLPGPLRSTRSLPPPPVP